MKVYHIYFYLLKLIILILVALISLKIIPTRNNFFIIIDSIFKLSLGLFIIIFFSTSNINKLLKEDRILIVLSGFILILLIDYISLINLFFNKLKIVS
jgi:hypothetical protein